MIHQNDLCHPSLQDLQNVGAGLRVRHDAKPFEPVHARIAWHIISELHPVTHHYWASVFYKHRAGFHFHSQQVRLSKHAASTSYGLPCQLLLGHRTFHRTIDPRISQEDVFNCQFVPTCSNKTMGIWWKLPGILILSCRIIGEIYPHVTLSHNITGYQEKWLHNITQSHQNPERNQSKNWPKLVENTMPPKRSK